MNADYRAYLKHDAQYLLRLQNKLIVNLKEVVWRTRPSYIETKSGSRVIGILSPPIPPSSLVVWNNQVRLAPYKTFLERFPHKHLSILPGWSFIFYTYNGLLHIVKPELKVLRALNDNLIKSSPDQEAKLNEETTYQTRNKARASTRDEAKVEEQRRSKRDRVSPYVPSEIAADRDFAKLDIHALLHRCEEDEMCAQWYKRLCSERESWNKETTLWPLMTFAELASLSFKEYAKLVDHLPNILNDEFWNARMTTKFARKHGIQLANGNVFFEYHEHIHSTRKRDKSITITIDDESDDRVFRIRHLHFDKLDEELEHAMARRVTSWKKCAERFIYINVLHYEQDNPDSAHATSIVLDTNNDDEWVIYSINPHLTSRSSFERAGMEPLMDFMVTVLRLNGVPARYVLLEDMFAHQTLQGSDSLCLVWNMYCVILFCYAKGNLKTLRRLLHLRVPLLGLMSMVRSISLDKNYRRLGPIFRRKIDTIGAYRGHTYRPEERVTDYSVDTQNMYTAKRIRGRNFTHLEKPRYTWINRLILLIAKRINHLQKLYEVSNDDIDTFVSMLVPSLEGVPSQGRRPPHGIRGGDVSRTNVLIQVAKEDAAYENSKRIDLTTTYKYTFPTEFLNNEIETEIEIRWSAPDVSFGTDDETKRSIKVMFGTPWSTFVALRHIIQLCDADFLMHTPTVQSLLEEHPHVKGIAKIIGKG